MNSGFAELEAVAGRIRTRVAEGRYPEAQSELQEYCQTLRKAVASLSPGDPRVHRLEQAWQQLLGETRRRALAGRAQAAERLARLPRRLPGYCEPILSRRTWECSG